jgi:Mg2+ and Co2+ transporter CorA
MIEMLALDHGALVTVDSADRAQFFRVVAPNDSELSRLAQVTGASAELLSAACDPDERPRVEVEDDARLLVLRVPCDLPESSTPVKTVAFGVIVTGNTSPRSVLGIRMSGHRSRATVPVSIRPVRHRHSSFISACGWPGSTSAN